MTSCPCCCSRCAATLLSTPPLMARTTRAMLNEISCGTQGRLTGTLTQHALYCSSGRRSVPANHQTREWRAGPPAYLLHPLIPKASWQLMEGDLVNRATEIRARLTQLGDSL